jgi:predicted MFS family arabinose efflux permease
VLPAVFLALCIATIPLAGGRLSALAGLQLRHMWAIFAAIGIQVLIISVIPNHLTELHPFVHLGTYALAAWFVLANRRIPGFWLIGLGGAMNLIAIVANGGTMPASDSALATAGLISEAPGEFLNSTALGSPNLAFLGDIFATPSWLPFANVFSLGDVSIVLGTALALHRLCGSRLVPSATGEFAELTKNRSFVRIWIALVSSSIGDFAYSIAVLVSLASRGVGPEILATLLIVQVAPAAVTGIFGAPLIDRFSRKWLMVASDLLRLAAVASLLLVPSPSLFHFYAVGACLGAFGAIFQPSLRASLPNLVSQRLLVAANSLVVASFHIAVMAGPLLGGLLAVRVGASGAFVVNAATFGISVAMIAGLRIPQGPSERTNTPRAFLEGVRYSLGTPLVRGILIVIGVAMFAASIKSPLEPLFVLRTIGGDPQALGFAEASWGLGMLIGSVAVPAATRRWRRVNLLHSGFALIGASVLIASFAKSLFPVLMLWIVAGFGNALATVSYSSLLQERTPDRLRGRVLATSEAVLDTAIVAGALLTGLLGSALGIRGAYALAGLLSIGAAVIGSKLLVPLREPQAPERPAGEPELADETWARSPAPERAAALVVRT